jgi:flagellar basal body-associated protein FliL
MFGEEHTTGNNGLIIIIIIIIIIMTIIAFIIIINLVNSLKNPRKRDHFVDLAWMGGQC